MVKKKVFVAILNQGTVSAGLEYQLLEWIKEKADKYQFSFSLPTDRPIANNRNKIAKRFLAGDWDYLFMLDSDNPPLYQRNIFDLLDFDKDVIAGICPGLGTDGIRFHVYKFGKEYPKKLIFKQYPPIERDGLKQVDAVGTGCIFIKRKVLEKVKRPFEDLFDEDGILITNDDMAFSHKCKQAGFEIWVHWDYACSHFKTVDLLQMTHLIHMAAQSGIARISAKGKILDKKIMVK